MLTDFLNIMKGFLKATKPEKQDPKVCMLTIDPIGETKNSTASRLLIDGKFFCFIIEDGHRDEKVPGETRIPAGTYNVVQRKFGEHFQKYRERFGHDFSVEIEDVPNFRNILIHIGNFIDDTAGCPLTNYGVRYNAIMDRFEGQLSTNAYLGLYHRLDAAWKAGKTVSIKVKRLGQSDS